MLHSSPRCSFFAVILSMLAAVKTEAGELPKHHMQAGEGYADIDGTVYRTKDELMNAVTALPAGSRLQLDTGCMGQRVIDTTPPIEVRDFKKFCVEHGVKFHVSSGLRF